MAFKTKEQQLASLHFSLQHSSVLKTSQRLVQVMDLVWVRRDKHLDNLDCWQCCCCGQIHFRGGEEPRVEGQREAFRDGIHKNPLHCNMLQMTRVTRRVTTLRPTMATSLLHFHLALPCFMAIYSKWADPVVDITGCTGHHLWSLFHSVRFRKNHSNSHAFELNPKALWLIRASLEGTLISSVTKRRGLSGQDHRGLNEPSKSWTFTSCPTGGDTGSTENQLKHPHTSDRASWKYFFSSHSKLKIRWNEKNVQTKRKQRSAHLLFL